jgi:uncharacterized protein with PQ loop repeat
LLYCKFWLKSIWVFFFFFFWNKVSLCCLGWPWASELKESSCLLSLQSSGDFRNILLFPAYMNYFKQNFLYYKTKHSMAISPYFFMICRIFFKPLFNSKDIFISLLYIHTYIISFICQRHFRDNLVPIFKW